MSLRIDRRRQPRHSRRIGSLKRMDHHMARALADKSGTGADQMDAIVRRERRIRFELGHKSARVIDRPGFGRADRDTRSPRPAIDLPAPRIDQGDHRLDLLDRSLQGVK